MSCPNHVISDARRAAHLAGPVPPSDIPHYDRTTTDFDSAGNGTIYYWDNRYTAPVHVQWVPAPPTVNDLAEETTRL